MSEEIKYFFSSLDLHLSMGKTPLDALAASVEDYAAVWHVDDDKTILARAATVALKHLREQHPELGGNTVLPPKD